jgi:hypothetical protein
MGPVWLACSRAQSENGVDRSRESEKLWGGVLRRVDIRAGRC